jgi:hypothetical protein
MSSLVPSSSSSAPDARFGRFLDASLAALRVEVPEAYAAMCGALAPRALRLEVDGEIITIRFEPDVVVEVPSSEPATVVLRTSRTSILAVVDAHHTLVSATLDGLLDLRGMPTDIAAFHDAFVRYLQGGVRAPSFPRLLADFRQATPPGGVS